MGEHMEHEGKSQPAGQPLEEAASRREFALALLQDLQAIEIMQSRGLFEKGIRRIGAEQEMCLVDRDFRPSNHGPEILEALADGHFTSEIARYTLEINLDPFRLEDHCFTEMEGQLRRLLRMVEKTAAEKGDRVVLAGILPTLGMRELEPHNMTPTPRYELLEQRISELRGGGDIELGIQGVDDLMMRHGNILFEACNTSFQVHLQVDPDDFVTAYNWAQAISAFVLAPAVNSPLLFGRQLWAETRIALFQQSVDTRSRDSGLRQRQARVYFGNRWIRNSLTEIFQEDIARYPLLFGIQAEDSLEQLEMGHVPKLRSLALHNGTIWKWNRPCFGSNGRVAHLRIENRYLPAGPTVTDEIANAAFWIGLMCGRPDDFREIWTRMEFDEAKENFLKVAQHGLDVELGWCGESRNARGLILDYFLPMAQQGLERVGVATAEIAKYLQVIEHRVVRRRTGARWFLETFRKSHGNLEMFQRQTAMTEQYWKLQQGNLVVGDWPIPDLKTSGRRLTDERVDLLMTTDLITLGPDDALALADEIMKWRQIQHLPIENQQGEVIGVLCRNDIQKHRLESDCGDATFSSQVTCADAMVAEPRCIGPESSLQEAKETMVQYQIGCLPVIRSGKLVGLVTKKDILRLEAKSSPGDTAGPS